MRPAVSAAWDLRSLLEYSPESLVRGCMLLTPGQRARLRLALEEADSSVIVTGGGTVSLITDLEAKVEKVFGEVEAGVERLDGQALAEARRLLSEAKTAESQVLAVILSDRSQIVALAEEYGPELVAAVEAVLKDLLVQVNAAFRIVSG